MLIMTYGKKKKEFLNADEAKELGIVDIVY